MKISARRTPKALWVVAFLSIPTFPVRAADSVRTELIQAAKTLDEQANYSWDTTVKVPEGTRFPPGPTTGRTEKDVIVASTSRGQTTTEIVIVGDKAAATDRNGEWQTLDEIERAPGFGRFTAAMVRSLKTPAREALDVVDGLTGIRKDGDSFVGDLTEEGAKELAAASSGFGRRGGRGGRGGQGGGAGSNVIFAKASARFWVKQGMLVRFEETLDASIDFNGNELVVERTTTTVVKDIGSTKIEIPAAANAKLQLAKGS
jgi:hypothetical protein